MIAQRRPRAAVRSWFEEFDELAGKGFVWRSDYDCAQLHAKVCTGCCEDMEVRLFEQRDVSYRVYALCVMCGWWLEL